MSEFNFKVLTPNGVMIDENIQKVIVTTLQGEITILKNHIPLISLTKRGRLVIFSDDKVKEYVADSGVLKVNKDETVLMSNKIEISQ